MYSERGAVLVCGGLGGVMDAAARGATRDGASAHLDISIPTGMGHARNALVALAGDAVIAIGAGYGTLSEVGLALKMGKPVAGLKTWVLSRSGEEDVGVVQAGTAHEAVATAFSAIGLHRSHGG